MATLLARALQQAMDSSPPGSTSASEEQAAPGSGSNLPLSVLIVATTAAGLSTLFSCWTIWMQLKNYRKPKLQRFVVRILMMVPIYAISSLLSLYSLAAAFYVDAVRDLYEAFVIYCFFSLLVEYLGGERSLLILLHGRPPVSHPWPMSTCIAPMDASDPFTFLALKRGVLQYVQLKPLLVIITFVLKATGTYKDGSLEKDAGYTYVSIAYNLSVSISLYSLAMFWVATGSDLKPYRPMPKFLCVKGLIFFSFWQGFAVSVLVALGWVHSHRYDIELLSLAIQDTLICLEMPLFAFMHLYAFSYTDYIDENHLYSGRLPVWYAIRDFMGYKDILSDSKTTVKGTGFSYRTFEPAEGGLHVGRGRDRRVRAGLRYAEGGKKKYWLDMPGEEGDAHGRKGGSSIVAKPFHSVRRVLEERLDVRAGYAPLTADEAADVIHKDIDSSRSGLGETYEGEDWRRWKDENGGIDSDDEESVESLGFGDVQEDKDMEGLYHDAKTLEFGDWSYPVVDASKEDVRRRLREEEEGRVHPNRLKTKAKGKERATRPTAHHKYSYGQLGELNTERKGESSTAPDREEGLPPRQPASPAEQATESDHPAPEGAQLLSGVRHVVHTVTGSQADDDAAAAKRAQEEAKKRLPADAVDLVVEDHAAEESEAIQARRRGEPGGKKKRVYRQTYVSPNPSPNLQPLEVPGASPRESASAGQPVSPSPLPNERVEVLDTVRREPAERGKGEGESTDEIRRIRVVEEELVAKRIDGPPSSASDGGDNPWH